MIKEDVLSVLQKDQQLFSLAENCSDEAINYAIFLMLDHGKKHLTEDESKKAVKQLIADTMRQRVPDLETLEWAMNGLNSCGAAWAAAKIWSNVEPAHAEKMKAGWSLALAAAGLVAMTALALRDTEHKRQKGIFQNIYRCWHSVEVEYGVSCDPILGEPSGRDRRVKLSQNLTQLVSIWLKSCQEERETLKKCQTLIKTNTGH